MRSNNDGFTLVELLVAILLLFIIMVGFLKGILDYTLLSLRAQMKDEAMKIGKSISNYIESLPPDAPLFRPTAFIGNWNNAPCSGTSCAFENRDSDSDGIPDFYDPYNGNNDSFKTTPLNTAGWLYVYPSGGGCLIRNNTTSSIPAGVRCVNRFKGRDIYLALTIARVAPPTGTTPEKVAVGIVVWYFDPWNGKYKDFRTLVIRGG